MVLTHLILFNFFHGATASDIPPPVPPSGPPQSGVRNRGGKRRRWALRYYGKLYYFDDLRALEEFSSQPPAEAMREGRPKAKAKPKLVVPVETVREAKEAGFDGLLKLAERMDLEALKRIEALMQEDDEDFRDFMEFTEFVKWMTR